MRRLLVICALGAGTAFPPAVDAGSYTVKACHADVGWVNNAWSSEKTMEPTDFASFQACPPGAVDPYGSVAQGIGVSDRLGGTDVAADGRFAEWRVDAPVGTRVTAYAVQRDIGNRNHLASGAFTPYARTDDGDLSSQGCFVTSGFYCRQQGSSSGSVDSAFLAWGIRCVQTAFCGPGADLHHVWVTISSAAVTVTDDVAPSIESPGGSLAAGGWVRGDQTVTVAASDSTGIRRLGVEVDGVTVASRTAPDAGAGGCGTLNKGVAYSYVAPCAGARGLNGPQTLTVATNGLTNGTRTLRVAATDTGSNTTWSGARTVRIDHEPPPVPVLWVDGAWSSSATASVTWSVPIESDRAPIAGMEVEQCDAGGCRVHELPGAGGGAAITDERPAATGSTGFRARHRDAAGNWSAWSATATVRRDRDAPAVELAALPREVAVGATVVPEATGSDALSGVRAVELEWQANGGSWRPVNSGVRLDAPGVARVRARAIDEAGNTGAWVGSSDIGFVAPSPGTVTPPAATPESTFGAPPLQPVSARGLRLRQVGQKVKVSGSLVPREATGRLRVVVRVRRSGRVLRRGASTRAGSFRTAVRVPAGSRLLRRVRLIYAGDALHAARSWRVRVPRR